jgi:hypothetical protein
MLLLSLITDTVSCTSISNADQREQTCLYRNKQTNAESEVKTGESTVSHNFTTHSYKWSALKGSGLFCC